MCPALMTQAKIAMSIQKEKISRKEKKYATKFS